MQPSLRLLLVLTFGGVVMALVTLLSLIIGQISTHQLEADARQSLATVADEMASRLGNEISERYREIALLAATNETLRASTPSLAEQSDLLTKTQESHPDFAWIGVANTTGTVTVATDDRLIGKSVAELPWFQAGAVAPFIGNLHDALLLAKLLSVPAKNNEPPRLIDFAAPIVDPQGQLVGVLGAQLDWQWVRQLEQDLVRLMVRADGVQIFVVDQDGTLLLAPPGWSGQTLDLSKLANEQPSGALVETWPDGQRYVTGYATVQKGAATSGPSWLVLVRQPVAVAYSPAMRTQWLSFGVGVFFAALFGLLAWWLAGRITDQLETLTRAAEGIRHGEGDSIPVLTGTAEVASLSTSLNHLIADLTTATVAERNRIARELHDSVTQTLFSTSMLADVLPQVWENDPATGRAKLEELRRAMRGALAEMRTLLLELRPNAIADAAIQQLLRQQADSISGRTGVNVTWRIEGDVDLPAERKVVAYRLVQEALNNVVKHAHADHVQLVLRNNEQGVELVIIDDGIGFDPTAVSGDHFGIKIMRERVEASGGLLRIESHPHEGTEIHALWNGKS
ncbi:MAG TPA: histidine kinase [Caldilineaceae bacterium]|nr:histidine kinase [Caldilineaceae bacterium]